MRGSAPPAGLLALLLDALPTCQTLKSLTVDLEARDSSAAQELVRIVPHLRLEELCVDQVPDHVRDDPESNPHPDDVSAVLRAVLNDELSQIRILTIEDFDLTDIDTACWDLLAANRTFESLALEQCYMGESTFDLLARPWIITRPSRCYIYRIPMPKAGAARLRGHWRPMPRSRSCTSLMPQFLILTWTNCRMRCGETVR